MPLILGLDTATDDTSVATWLDGSAMERRLGPDGGRPVHGTRLLATIEELVTTAGGWGEVDSIAVGIGPGSFTGLRIGISTARALAQSQGIPMVPVPSTSALLAGIAESPDADGRRPLAVIDARRGEVFTALGNGAKAGDPFVCPPGDLAAQVGPETLAGAIAGGNGALRFRSEIEASGALVLPEGDPAHGLSARLICDLAANIEPVAAEQIRPLYLRRPDAERWRERDGSN
jgi:tRNA threonylcarbamoyladenosine biosynthesis protein TsaB